MILLWFRLQIFHICSLDLYVFGELFLQGTLLTKKQLQGFLCPEANNESSFTYSTNARYYCALGYCLCSNCSYPSPLIYLFGGRLIKEPLLLVHFLNCVRDQCTLPLLKSTANQAVGRKLKVIYIQDQQLLLFHFQQHFLMARPQILL